MTVAVVQLALDEDEVGDVDRAVEAMPRDDAPAAMASARGSASRDRTVNRWIGRGPGATAPTLRGRVGRGRDSERKVRSVRWQAMESEELPPTRLVLVRHGESMASVNRSIGGPRTCAGLSDLGRRQCERLGTRLAETGELGDVVLCSSRVPPRHRDRRAAGAGARRRRGPDRRALGRARPRAGVRRADVRGVHRAPRQARTGRPTRTPSRSRAARRSPSCTTGSGRPSATRSPTTSGARWSSAATAASSTPCCGWRCGLRRPVTSSCSRRTPRSPSCCSCGPGRWRLVRYNDAAHLAGL